MQMLDAIILCATNPTGTVSILFAKLYCFYISNSNFNIIYGPFKPSCKWKVFVFN